MDVKVNYLINGEVQGQTVDLDYLLAGYLKVPTTKKVKLSIPTKKECLNPPKTNYEHKSLREIYKLSIDHYIAGSTIDEICECLEKL